MKHFLNIPPTVKYRKGSSFMFKITIGLLYILPIMITTLMLYRYYGNLTPAQTIAHAQERLEKHGDLFRKKLMLIRPDFKLEKQKELQLLEYYRALSGFTFSWNFLLKTMERVLPDGARITRLSMKPASVVKIGISGEAQSLDQVTQLLRSLQEVELFSMPRLKRHSLVVTKEGKRIQFELGVSFLPGSEVQNL